MNDFVDISLNKLCLMCCYERHLTIGCSNTDKSRCQLYGKPHTSRNNRCNIVHYRAREGKGCKHTNVTCVNCTGSHFVSLLISSARRYYHVPESTSRECWSRKSRKEEKGKRRQRRVVEDDSSSNSGDGERVSGRTSGYKRRR